MNHSSDISSRFMGWLGVFASMLLFSHCTTPIDIDVPQQESLLVIDGLITDGPGPYTVRLSLSSQLNELMDNPVSDATVVIEEEGGVRVALQEQTEGKYVTDSLSIRGQAGKRYRLEVSRGNSQNYQSEWVLLKPSPPIKNVYYEFGPLQDLRIPVSGIKIFIDAEDAENKTRFYRWEWESTWQHVAPFASGLIFLGNDETEQGPRKWICYNGRKSNSILIASSLNNTKDVISKFPLHQVSGFGSELRYRYSLLVKQYALNEDEFLFWKSVQEANENSGALFDRQPQSNNSNLFRVEDENEPVLGYFSASGYVEQRIFVNRIDLPDDAIIGEQYILNCIVNSDTLFKGMETDLDVFSSINTGRVFFDFFRNPDIQGWILATKDCSDCTREGGTTTRPGFW